MLDLRRHSARIALLQVIAALLIGFVALPVVARAFARWIA